MDLPYTCMIIDDEPDAIDYLSALIGEHCPQLKIVATATDSASARNKYFYHLPGLLFMDIQVDEKNGFDIYKDLYREKLNPVIIFVTAYNQYAIRAFRANALDYLLKPVDPVELTAAVKKFADSREKEIQGEKINTFISRLNARIRFHTREGFIFFDTDEIIYCEADANYTKIFTTPEKFTVVSHNLGQVEKLLPSRQFWRTSRSHLANLKYLSQVDRVKKICFLKSGTGLLKLPALSNHIGQISP